MVVFGQSGFILLKWVLPGKVVVFGQKLLHSGKLLYLGKIGYIRQAGFFFGKCGCIRAKQLYSGKVVVNFGKSGCFSAKLVIFGQIWFYLGR